MSSFAAPMPLLELHLAVDPDLALEPGDAQRLRRRECLGTAVRSRRDGFHHRLLDLALRTPTVRKNLRMLRWSGGT